MNPKITIVIPTYNRATKVLKPIYSVIKQTYRNWQMVIVDDCSSDDTSDIIGQLVKEQPQIKYVRLGVNSGPSRARNYGMEFANTEYSAFLDSDDSLDETFLKKMCDTLDKNQNCALTYCDSQIFDLEKKPYYVFTFDPYNYQELINSHGKIPTGSFMFRTDCWYQVGGFREDMNRGEDFEWQLRFGELFDFIRVPEILHYYFRDADGLICNTLGADNISKSLEILNRTKFVIKRRKFLL